MAEFFELPVNVQDENAYRFTVNLDGQNYSFRINYNKRNDTFHLSVLDSNERLVISDVPLLSYVLTTTRFAFSALMPSGDVMVGDAKDGKYDPTYENFGKNISAFYVSIREEQLEDA